MLPPDGEKTMKGRITCPRCAKEFTANAKDGSSQVTVTCPNCGHKITVKTKIKDKSAGDDSSVDVFEEVSWEEHGEPRKTVLSSMKPRTDRPMLASLILILVVIIGFSSALFPEAYLQTPLDVLSATGATGTVTLTIQNQSGIPLENVYVQVGPLQKNMTNSSGSTTLTDIPLGKQSVSVSFTANGSSESKEFFVLPIHSVADITVKNNVGTLQIIDQSTSLVWCSSIVILLSIVCIFGVIASWKRQHFDAAIVCTTVGIFTIGFYFMGSILSILALVLLLKSKEEFDDGKKGKSF